MFGVSYPLTKAPLLIACCLMLAACGPTPQKRTRYEIEGTQPERVARAITILAKYCQLPGLLLDAHMAEDIADNSGGMVPGPSDSYLSGVITFAASDLPAWRATLSPQLQVTETAEFHSVLNAPDWWPASAAFAGCEFYSPRKLTGRSGGFVALSPSVSAIYFSTF